MVAMRENEATRNREIAKELRVLKGIAKGDDNGTRMLGEIGEKYFYLTPWKEIRETAWSLSAKGLIRITEFDTPDDDFHVKLTDEGFMAIDLGWLRPD